MGVSAATPTAEAQRVQACPQRRQHRPIHSPSVDGGSGISGLKLTAWNAELHNHRRRPRIEEAVAAMVAAQTIAAPASIGADCRYGKPSRF